MKPSLRASHRPRRTAERVALGALGLLAIGHGGMYLAGLLYLLARGGAKALSFTAFPTPLADVPGEEGMRWLVGTVLFGALGWPVASLIVRFVRVQRRWVYGATLVIAASVAAAMRDHLPRFLISLPSETQAGGGVGPEIFNTLYFATLSTALTMPVGVGAAIYVARFAKSTSFVATFRTALDTLASLPSIVYGLFGFLVFVVQMKAGYSLFAGAFVLALLNLPLVVGITEESLRSVPRELEEASLALGATTVQTTLRVTLPYAWPGILSALVLSIGRVFAESAPLIMTAGTTISRSNAYSLDPFRGGETLAVHLWYVNSAGLSPDKADVSAGTAAVLVLLILLTNALAAKLGRFGGPQGARLGRATQA
jgi:phosphate transport system permease protein